MIEIINSIRKYNYRNGNSFDLFLGRMFYTDKCDYTLVIN